MAMVIKNARIVNDGGQAPKAQDILIDRGRIVEIRPSLNEPGSKSGSKPGVKVLDAAGRLVLPGLIDLHVHFREPGQEHKETIATGSKAAVKGGFTTVMCMPNTRPVIDNAMIVEGIIKEAERVGLCRVIPIGAITRGQKDEELTDMVELKEAGCLALSDDGKSVLNPQMMRLAMEYAKMAGLLLIEHCQEPLLTNGGAMNEGYHSALLGIKGDPGIAETVIVARDIELAHYLKTPVHMAHMSLKRSVELIRAARAQGIPVTAEVTPHHFTLTDAEVKSFNTHAKVNPPLRTPEDVEAMKEGLQDGTIDCIATDHAPHTKEDKEQGFDCSPPGLIGLETSLGLAVTELIEKKVLTWPQLADKMSAAPARLIGLEKKGRVAPGYDADLTVIDPDEEWTVSEEDTVSKSKNTPFLGRSLKGRVKATVFGGKIVYQE